MGYRYLIYLAIISLFISSCESNNKKELAISSKLFALQEQGWKSKQISHFVGDIQYRAAQVPNEYYLLKNSPPNEIDSISTRANALKNERIIEFEFEHFNNKDLLEPEFTNVSYEEAVKYMASKIGRDFKAVTTAMDTINCAGAHFERHFKVSSFNRVLLYFSGIPENENIQLIYQDQLFNNGTFKFKFDEIPFKS